MEEVGPKKIHIQAGKQTAPKMDGPTGKGLPSPAHLPALEARNCSAPASQVVVLAGEETKAHGPGPGDI